MVTTTSRPFTTRYYSDWEKPDKHAAFTVQFGMPVKITLTENLF